MRALAVFIALLLVVVTLVSARRAHTLSEHKTQGLFDTIGNIVNKVVPVLNARFQRHIDLTKINALNCIRFGEVSNLVTLIKNRKLSWEAAHNDFSCWAKEDLSRLTGAIIAQPPANPGSLEVQGEAVRSLSADELDAIPSSFDSSTYWPGCIADVQNQGTCGSCWSFSGLSTLADRLCIKSNGAIKKPVLSAQQLVSCAENNGCAGGLLDKMWTYARDTGAVTNDCYPYSTGTMNQGTVPTCATTCANGQALSTATRYKVNAPSYNYNGYLIAPYKPTNWRTNVPLIQKEIMTNGPVQAAFTCTRELYNYKSGVYKCINCNDTVGGHAIKITGWGTAADGTQYWIISNSWGTSWGMNGFINFAMGQLGIEDSVYAGIPIIPSTTPTTQAPAGVTTKAPVVVATTTAPTPAASSPQQQTINAIFAGLQSWFTTNAKKTLTYNANAANLCQTQTNFFVGGQEAFGTGGWTAVDQYWSTPRWTTLYSKFGAKGGYESVGYRYDALPAPYANNVVTYLTANVANLANYNSVGIGLSTVAGSSQTYYVIEFVQ